MKIIEQEKEIEELKKQLSLLSQDRGLKRWEGKWGLPCGLSYAAKHVKVDLHYSQ